VAFKNSLQWGKNILKKKKKEARKQNPLKYPLLFHCEEREECDFTVIAKISMYGYERSSNPLLQERPPPSQGIGCKSTALQPYQEVLFTVWGVKNVFWWRDFH